jgi:hypothetical protein
LRLRLHRNGAEGSVTREGSCGGQPQSRRGARTDPDPEGRLRIEPEGRRPLLRIQTDAEEDKGDLLRVVRRMLRHGLPEGGISQIARPPSTCFNSGSRVRRPVIVTVFICLSIPKQGGVALRTYERRAGRGSPPW